MGSQLLLGEHSEVSDPLVASLKGDGPYGSKQLVIWQLLRRCCPDLGQSLLSTRSSEGSTIESAGSEHRRSEVVMSEGTVVSMFSFHSRMDGVVQGLGSPDHPRGSALGPLPNHISVVRGDCLLQLHH